MIKGVNKAIIEVNDTGNKYFEKAILFVKSDYKDTSKKTLEKHAKEFISNQCSNNKTNNTPLYEYFDLKQDRKRKRRLFLILGGYFLLLFAIVMAIIMR